MAQKPRKGNFREWRIPRTPQEACTFGSRLRNQSVSILHLRLTMVYLSNHVQGQLLGSFHILMFDGGDRTSSDYSNQGNKIN